MELDKDKKIIKKDNQNTDKVLAFNPSTPLAERKVLHFIQYTIKENDSISSIGDGVTKVLRKLDLLTSVSNSKEYIDQIKKWNSLNNDLVCYVGQKIKLPVYTNSQANEYAQLKFMNSQPKLKPNAKTKTTVININPGDSLIKIAMGSRFKDWQKWKLIFDLNKALENSSVKTPSLIVNGGKLHIPQEGLSYLDIFDSSPLAIKLYAGKEINFNTKSIKQQRDGKYSHDTLIFAKCIATDLVKVYLNDFTIQIVDETSFTKLQTSFKTSDNKTKMQIDLIFNSLKDQIFNSLKLEPTISYDSNSRIGLSFASKNGNEMYDYEFSAGTSTGKVLTWSLKIITKKLIQTEFGAWKGSISLSVEVEVGGCTQEKKENYEILVQVSILAISTVNLIWLAGNNVTGVGVMDDGFIPYYLERLSNAAKSLFIAILQAAR